MVQLHFITPDGEQITIDVPAEGTVMEAAKARLIPGIDADCGGSMVCGTCHVLIDPKWQNTLPEQSSMEAGLLEYVPEPQPNTRLTCQIPVTAAIHGITLQVPRLQR